MNQRQTTCGEGKGCDCVEMSDGWVVEINLDPFCICDIVRHNDSVHVIVCDDNVGEEHMMSNDELAESDREIIFVNEEKFCSTFHITVRTPSNKFVTMNQ